MNVVKTRQYYAELRESDFCDCAYCKNYVRTVRSAYPKLADYLNDLGADIEKPFETIPTEPEDGMLIYCGVQYVVMGDADDFREASVGSVRVSIADSHPMTSIKEPHFVIEVSPVSLKWTGDEGRPSP